MGTIEGAGMPPTGGRDGSTLRDHLQVLRRRRWVVLQAALVVPLVALLASLRQEPVYSASAEVLVSLQATHLGLPGSDAQVSVEPERLLQTQADLAAVPAVAERVLRKLEIEDRTADEFLEASSVATKPNSDFLRFTVEDGDREGAVRLATEYARQFTVYRRTLDTGSLRSARREIDRQIAALEERGERDSSLYSTLVERRQELATTEALQAASVALVRPATQAVKVQPRPARDGVMGLVLGLILGVGLAFLWEALDTRVRTTVDIERRLRLPLLARLPEPPRWLQRGRGLIMLAEPNSIEAEAFRVLRTNLEFFNLEHGARTIMFTSAVQGEGKSTTVANLAVALARAGQRIVLIDLDLRRPALGRFFDLQEAVGLTDVVEGRAQLATVGDAAADGAEGGRLDVLTAGPPLRDTGELFGSPKLTAILDEVRERADLVLIDSPPLLAVGDAIALSSAVDAVVVLTRLNVVRRATLEELRRVLGSCPAAKLGFVVTGADAEPDYRYGYGYGYGRPYAERARTGDSRW